MMFKRDTRKSSGRRLSDLHHGSGLDGTLLAWAFILGIAVGIWIAAANSD